MRKQYITIISTILLLGISEIVAQQDAQYTQYMYNTTSINPAYAGTKGVFSAALLHRSQWAGIDGAPETQTLTINTPVGVKRQIGLGMSIVKDKIGPVNETIFGVDFSYSIPVSINGKLALGIKAGGNLLDVNFQKLSQFQINDPNFQENIDNKFSPQLGLGAYYYVNKFYVGISAPNLLENEHFDESSTVDSNDSSSFIAKERVNYYLMTGYVFDINPNLKFKPAVLLKAVSGAPLNLDTSANFLINDRFLVGASYRWGASVNFIGGFQISNQFFLGLAYDREVTELGKTEFNSGSFEAVLRFELFKKAGRILSPRFF